MNFRCPRQDCKKYLGSEGLVVEGLVVEGLVVDLVVVDSEDIVTIVVELLKN
jgi:hypothetical protein